MGMEKNIKILLIEDNPGDAFLIEDHLEEFANFSYELKNVGTLGEALSILKEQPYDVILSDLSLPDSDGINTFFRIHNENPLVPVIILSGSNDEEIGAYAVKNGAHDYFVKGKTDGRLLECINACISKYSIGLNYMI
jgi:CheY-like chemotaxis protein